MSLINLRYHNTFVAVNKCILLILCSLLSLPITAQKSVEDTVKVKAIKLKFNGFTPEYFIRLTQKDTSFYRAFKNLKIFPHYETSEVFVFEKDGDEKASMTRLSQHFNKKNYNWIKIISENTEGKYYDKKGEPRYFTGEMFDRVFFSKDTSFASNTVKSPYEQKAPEDRSKTEKYYEQLKAFMFSPGQKIEGVPFIGYKLDIYGEEMRPYYDFSLDKVLYEDSIPCYLFSSKRKEAVDKNKVVIQYLDTYYDRRTMQVICRKYYIRDRNLAFDFDIKMEIKLQLIGTEYFPSTIKYKGEWDIPFKKPERMSFTITTKLD